LEPIEGRPGSFLKDYDFDKERAYLKQRYGDANISEKDLLSYALYPSVYTEWRDFQATFGEVASLPTHLFLNPMKKGDEVEIEIGVPGDRSRVLIVKLVAVDEFATDGTRMVLFNVNGEPWFMPITDLSSVGERAAREKATERYHVGSPMSGVVVGLKVQVGNIVSEGESLATLSAMKMETSMIATVSGTIKRILVNVGDKVKGGDLVVEIEPAEHIH
jgi:pyruvate carboxylase